MQEDERLEDVPMALVLYPDNEQRDLVRDALEQVGYQVVLAQGYNDARERMRFTNFACVVQHSQFEGPALARLNLLPVHARYVHAAAPVSFLHSHRPGIQYPL